MNLRGALLYRCGGGQAQVFDERSAWKPSAEEPPHEELSAQSGFLCRVTPALRKSQQIGYQGRTTERRELLDRPEPAKSISLSKCPMFSTNVLFKSTNPSGNEYTSARTTENGSAIGLSQRS